MIHNQIQPASDLDDARSTMSVVPSETGEGNDNNNNNWERRAHIASNLSLVANVVLLAANFTGYWLTGSLALLSTTADSFLDLLSQLIIAAALRGNRNVDKDIWPLGRSRLEPVGLMVVASLMGVAAFQILGEAIVKLSEGASSATPPKAPQFELYSIVIVSVAIGIKSVLFVVCYSVAKFSSSMQVLAEDHRNDVLSNIVALAAGLISNAVPSAWFADPIGGLLISIYICIRWILVGREQAMMLVGRVAHPDFLERVRTIAINHDPNGMDVDIIRAYHFGHRFLVEIEVVVSPSAGIVYAHDSALSLQKKIESLEEVERAHVHVDYAHRDEDEHKQTFHATVTAERSNSSGNLGLHRRHRYNAVESVPEPIRMADVGGI
jgi:cation diffusion facilitator family transporter